MQKFGKRWGVRALYTDYREMLEKERPDLVTVTTHTPLHAEVTIAGAEAGVGGKGSPCEVIDVRILLLAAGSGQTTRRAAAIRSPGAIRFLCAAGRGAKPGQ